MDLRRFAITFACSTCCFLTAENVRADGPIDPTFADGGQPFIYFDYPGSGDIRLTSVAQDFEGRLISAGDNESSASYLVTRLNRESPIALDAAFGSNGVGANPYGMSPSGATALAIDHHDRIVTAGYIALHRSCGSSTDVLTYYFSAARLKNGEGVGDGSADPTFGTGPLSGVTGVSVGDCSYTRPPRALVIGDNDDVTLGGGSYNGVVGGIALVRWDASGSLVTSFGSGGIVTAYSSVDTAFGAMAMDTQERIVTAAFDIGPHPHHIFVNRFDKNGNLDNSFGASGVVAIDLGEYSLACCIAIDSSNRIVVAGTVSPSSAGNYAVVARLFEDGRMDTSFGDHGISKRTLQLHGIDGLALDSQSRPLVVGDSEYGVAALAHLNLDGTLNAAVGFDGVFTTPIGLGFSTATSVLIDEFGRTNVAVEAEDRGGRVSAVVRYDELFGEGFD